jgi:hypothetical protein
MLCDYHVAKCHDRSYQASCLDYAHYVDIDGAHAKAAWYYLLGGQPERALKAARKALAQGQSYAAEYAWLALMIQGKRQEADRVMKRYRPTLYAMPKAFDQDLMLTKILYPQIKFPVLSQEK